MEFLQRKAQEKGLVSIFSQALDNTRDLGENQGKRCLICCRMEFIQKDQDFSNWFGGNAGLTKWFIAPLLITDFNFKEHALIEIF